MERLSSVSCRRCSSWPGSCVIRSSQDHCCKGLEWACRKSQGASGTRSAARAHAAHSLRRHDAHCRTRKCSPRFYTREFLPKSALALAWPLTPTNTCFQQLLRHFWVNTILPVSTACAAGILLGSVGILLPNAPIPHGKCTLGTVEATSHLDPSESHHFLPHSPNLMPVGT